MRKHKIFKKFSRPLQEELSLLFKEKQIRPEEFIFREGEESEKVYFLLSGSVEVLVSRKVNKFVSGEFGEQISDKTDTKQKISKKLMDRSISSESFDSVEGENIF